MEKIKMIHEVALEFAKLMVEKEIKYNPKASDEDLLQTMDTEYSKAFNVMENNLKIAFGGDDT